MYAKGILHGFCFSADERQKKRIFACTLIPNAMFLLIFFAIVAAMLATDLLRYRRRRRRGERGGGPLFAAKAILDLLPLLLFGAASGIDNTPTVMRIMMWFCWAWFLLQLPRFVCYLFRALRLPRVGLAAGVLVAFALLYGAIWGRRDLRVEQVEICSARIPAAFDGYRVAFFSDLHLGALVDTEGEVGGLVARINALQPDVVLFGGDLVNIRCSELDTAAQRLLRQIEAPVYSVLGNHDVGSYIRDTVALPSAVSTQCLIGRQQAMGWHLLQDSTVYLHRGADSIALSGITFDPAQKDRQHHSRMPQCNTADTYRGVPRELFDITLVHLPQYWSQVTDCGYGDLTLSGHTHAMQLKLHFGRWRGWSPARLLYKEWSGRYDRDGRTLYITDGVGYVGYPMRIGAPPELTLFILKLCE